MINEDLCFETAQHFSSYVIKGVKILIINLLRKKKRELQIKAPY